MLASTILEVNTGQGKHAVEDALVLYVPIGQAVHDIAFKVSVK